MGLSVLCLLHCLALPWLLASLPVVVFAALPEPLRHNEWFHAALIGPVLLVSGPVLLRGAPGKAQTMMVLAAFAALMGGLLMDNEIGERGLTMTGAGLLLAAHWSRLRQHHRH
ncbi:MAG: hypothetical protein OHK0018_16370 [Erythrobacter tepidarius]